MKVAVERTNSRRRWICLIASLVALLGGCPWLEEVSGPPTIEFTYVPPIGSNENLRGKVSGVAALQNRVVVYIRVNDVWWVKPTLANPLTSISVTGSWVTDITTGGIDEQATEIRAYVVSSSYDADLHNLPSDDVVLASVSTTR